MTPPTDDETREAANRLHHDEGTLEIDDNAKVSRGDDNPDHGAYVAAWVWVPDEDVDPKYAEDWNEEEPDVPPASIRA